MSNMLYYTSSGRHVGCWVTHSWYRNWVVMSSSEREENLIEHISYHVANVYNNHVHFDTCSMIHGLCTISPPAFRRSGVHSCSRWQSGAWVFIFVNAERWGVFLLFHPIQGARYHKKGWYRAGVSFLSRLLLYLPGLLLLLRWGFEGGVGVAHLQRTIHHGVPAGISWPFIIRDMVELHFLGDEPDRKSVV